MKSSLQIARQHFAVSGLANDNNFYFGDEVPKDAVDQYNAHLTAVDSITQQQDDLMAAYNAQVQAEQAQQDEQAEP
ncbi:MAG: hypothetical protein JJ974_09315 [Phycisphaerales bacterium]|nr:hypothetical protein [Phycisphaerales bacterium]